MKKINAPRAERSEPILTPYVSTGVGERSRSAVFSSKLLIVVITALALSACSATASTPTAIPTVSLDSNNNSSSNSQSSDANSVSASANIVPLKKAELSFANVGRVKAVDVKVGDQV